MKVKVTPTRKQTTAPYTIIEISNSIKNPVEKAERQVKQESGLGRFDEWIFIGERI